MTVNGVAATQKGAMGTATVGSRWSDFFKSRLAACGRVGSVFRSLILFFICLKLLKIIQLSLGKILPNTPTINKLQKVQTILVDLFALVLPVD